MNIPRVVSSGGYRKLAVMVTRQFTDLSSVNWKGWIRVQLTCTNSDPVIMSILVVHALIWQFADFVPCPNLHYPTCRFLEVSCLADLLDITNNHLTIDFVEQTSTCWRNSFL